jgi:hypothetical protein
MNDTAELMVLLCIAFIVGFFTGTYCMKVRQANLWQKDAVAHGKAEYYLDKDHDKQWRWKP